MNKYSKIIKKQRFCVYLSILYAVCVWCIVFSSAPAKILKPKTAKKAIKNDSVPEEERIKSLRNAWLN